MNKKITSTLTLIALGAASIMPIAAAADNPVPSVTSISPNSTYAGNAAITLTVNGANFVGNSSVYFDGNVKSTNYISANQLTAVIPASDLDVAGTYSVMVMNPTPGGGTSNMMHFTVLSSTSAPVITSISHGQVSEGGSNFTLTVNGANFVASNTASVVRINGSNRATAFVSTTQLTATILASDIASSGTRNITVYNSGPNNAGTSNAVTLVVNPSPGPIPVVTSISPSLKVVGSNAFMLTVNGANFNTSSVVNFNGSARATTYFSPNMLSAVILVTDLDTVGVNTINVTNPGQGTSNNMLFSVTFVPGLPNTGIGPDSDDPNPPQPTDLKGMYALVIALAALFAASTLIISLAKAGKKSNG